VKDTDLTGVVKAEVVDATRERARIFKVSFILKLELREI